MEKKKIRPWSGLERLRPLRTETLGRIQLNFARLQLGIKLLVSLFPGIVREHYPDLSDIEWYVPLGHLIQAAQAADFFPINWAALQDAWEFWSENEDDHGDHLAVWLRYIPLEMYGLTSKNIHEFPAMELMHALLDEHPTKNVNVDLLVYAGLYDVLDEWNHISRQRAWEKLKIIEECPQNYPETVRLLPELARWACRRTRNPLLDNHYDPMAPPGAGGWYTWESDLAAIRSAWVRAKPVIAAFHRLSDWAGEPGNMAHLADYILGGNHHERLNW